MDPHVHGMEYVKKPKHVGSEAGEEARFDVALRAVATNLVAWADQIPAMFEAIPRLKAELAAERERYAKLEWKLQATEGNRDAQLAAVNDMAERIAKLEAENARLQKELSAALMGWHESQGGRS